MNIVTNIALVIGVLTSAFNLAMLIIKPFRNLILGVKKDKIEKDKSEKRQIETDKCLLRNSILDIYYRNNQNAEIKLYEFENVEYMYKQYKALGGNSFVDKIWKEMQTWKVIK